MQTPNQLISSSFPGLSSGSYLVHIWRQLLHGFYKRCDKGGDYLRRNHEAAKWEMLIELPGQNHLIVRMPLE